MTYEQAVYYVENAALFNSKKDGLANISELLRRLGNPQASFKSLHVAGTNGKGSVCAFAYAALLAAGYKAALFTSPYLQAFNERMAVAGRNIGEDTFAKIATRVRGAAEGMVADGLNQCTFFELVTACAFLWFAGEGVDIAVLETGLGGDLDATNVVNPTACAITSIGLDHTALLGSTLVEIATRKAGIIKPGVPCVLSGGITGEVEAHIKAIAARRNAPLVLGSGYTIDVLEDSLLGQRFAWHNYGLTGEIAIGMLGGHQRHNALTAMLLCQQASQRGFSSLTQNAILTGLAKARWPGRLEVFRPGGGIAVIDGAHNPEGAEALGKAAGAYFAGQPITLVLGVNARKDYTAIARILAPMARVIIATQPGDGRGVLPAPALAGVLEGLGYPCQCHPSPAQAIAAALATGNIVVIAGSLYLAGIARGVLGGGL